MSNPVKLECKSDLDVLDHSLDDLDLRAICKCTCVGIIFSSFVVFPVFMFNWAGVYGYWEDQDGEITSFCVQTFLDLSGTGHAKTD